MIIIGLTGVLGSGKSTVARLLRERGLDVVDVDALAKDSLNWKKTRDDIKRAFGDEYVVDGQVDVVRLRGLVFAQGNELRKLEAIIHPRVRRELEKRIRVLKERGARAAIIDHPLLFEAGFDKKVDKVVVVTADMETIKTRLKKRGMQVDDIDRRLSFQVPLREKAARATYTINNNGRAQLLEKEVDKLLEKLTSWEEEQNASY